MVGFFGVLGYAAPILAMLLVFYVAFLKNDSLSLRQTAAIACLVLFFGMLIAFFSGTEFEYIQNGTSKVKDLYNVQGGGGILFGLPALLFYGIFDKAGSIIVLILLVIVAVIVLLGKGFLGKMADMLREMSENMQERRYREEQEYEEEEYEDYADEEDEDSLAREEAERERRREEQRKKIMRERRAQAKRNERRARELEAQKQAQKEEKRRRKSDEQKKRREAEERAEDERILRSSNRKTLNHVALEPTVPARHKLDDMHEITLMPEGDVTRLDAAARVQEVVYEEEEPVPE